ncbi:MAG: aminotransferase class I/II-fold pyridoxal phosphate-dependent enzyme [Eubacterium sp.]|nr:aminotransferase class I/II-fold pyridoxal phosphate-dependent enzyme [Eubacterium sp.]
MPGHKRKDSGNFFGIEAMDITEIRGYDNLHCPEGMIRESMDLLRKIYGTRESWYLVGGSTMGILISVSSVCKPGDKILIGRNCHKAVYNCIRLLQLEAVYCYPEVSGQFDVYKDMKPESIEEILKEHPDVKAVVITSPTYEGVVSDVTGIKKVLERYDIPLIVDEAHGGHLIFHEYFPKSAVECGADLVIQSTHKTLPSFTQTAVLHLCSELVSKERIEEMIDIYETSSPSYLLLASAEYGIMYMNEKEDKVNQYVDKLKKFRRRCGQFNHLLLIDANEMNCFDYDRGKLVISVKNTNISGKQLFDCLLNDYKIELEMENLTYGIAMTSVCDAEKDYDRLWEALYEIDREMEKSERTVKKNQIVYPKKIMESWECSQYPSYKVDLEQAEGKICGKYVMIYPPGSPILVPGEKIIKEVVENIRYYLYNGYNVTGISGDQITVIDHEVTDRRGHVK